MIIILILGGISIGAVALFMGATEYPGLFPEYFLRPGTMILNTLPATLILFLLYIIINRAGWSYAITYVLVVGLSFIDYYKIKLRDDPLVFADIDLISEAADISSRYTLSIVWQVVLAIALGILGTWLMHMFAKTRLVRSPLNILSVLIIVALAGGAYSLVYINTDVYAESGESDVVGQWSDKEKYVSRGFLYPLLYSSRQYFDMPDNNYNAEEAEAGLMQYTYDDIPADQKVAVFSIMCEAFNDFSKFNALDFEVDPYAAFHELEKHSLHGNLITNIFGGGTVNTERSFLTGYSDFNTFTQDTNSYVRYFDEQGYHTEGGHPGVQWYYDRDKINRYLGFTDYYYFENRYETESGFYIGDDEFFGDIKNLYESFRAVSDQPYFNFSVTYQNHGPYSEKLKYYSYEYFKNEGYSEKAVNVMNNYFAGIENTVSNIAGLADYLDTLNEPAVLIVFGDHNPWLGDDEKVYAELGIDVERESTDGFLNYYETPYIIYANQAAKETLHNPFVGNGGDFSPCFLMQRFFQAAGWGGNEYMKMSADMKKISPLVHQSGFYKEGRDVVSVLDRHEDREFFGLFSNMQYFWRNNFRPKDAMEGALRARADVIYRDGAGQEEPPKEDVTFTGGEHDGGVSNEKAAKKGNTLNSSTDSGRWRQSAGSSSGSSSGGSGRSGRSSGGSSYSGSGGGSSGGSGSGSGSGGGSGVVDDSSSGNGGSSGGGSGVVDDSNSGSGSGGSGDSSGGSSGGGSGSGSGSSGGSGGSGGSSGGSTESTGE